MSGNFGDDLRKLMMAGIGAFSTAAEKTRDLINEFSEKGEETAQKTRDFIDDMAAKGEETLEANRDLMDKFKGAFESIKKEASQFDLDEIVSSLNGLTDEALEKLNGKLEDVIRHRGERAEEDGEGESLD